MIKGPTGLDARKRSWDRELVEEAIQERNSDFAQVFLQDPAAAVMAAETAKPVSFDPSAKYTIARLSQEALGTAAGQGDVCHCRLEHHACRCVVVHKSGSPNAFANLDKANK